MPWTRETLSSLRTQLEARVESSPFWTTEEARLALNEALSFWQLLTGYWYAAEDVQILAGDPFFATSAAILFRTRVTYQGLPLADSSLTDLFRGRPNWWTETTADGGDVPTRPTVWAPMSLTLLAVWPQPAGIATLTVQGLSRTPVLAAEADPVDIEDGIVDHILGYALHVLTFKEGWARFAGTTVAMQEFLKAAGEENGQLTASGAYRQYLGLDQAKHLRPTRGKSRLGGSVAMAGGLSVPGGGET